MSDLNAKLADAQCERDALRSENGSLSVENTALRASVDTLRKERDALREVASAADAVYKQDDAWTGDITDAQRKERFARDDRMGFALRAVGLGYGDFDPDTVEPSAGYCRACDGTGHARAALETTPPPAKPEFACWRCDDTGIIPEGRVGAGAKCLCATPPQPPEQAPGNVSTKADSVDTSAGYVDGEAPEIAPPWCADCTRANWAQISYQHWRHAKCGAWFCPEHAKDHATECYIGPPTPPAQTERER